MSKSKSAELPHYELLYIIANKYSEDELPAIQDKVKKLIEAAGGQISLTDNWGKRRLAYPIKHWRHGYYQLLRFTLPGDKLNKINQALRLDEQILRHQFIKDDPRNLPASQVLTNRNKAAAAAKSADQTERQAKPKDELTDLDLDEILATNTLL